MSVRDEYIERRSSNVRIAMDLGMGLFYATIGAILLYAKSFGHMQIPAYAAYIIGAMLVIGGVYRFYKGLKAFLPVKKEKS